MRIGGSYGLAAVLAAGGLSACTAAAPTGLEPGAGPGRVVTTGNISAAGALDAGNKLQADPPMAVGGYARGVYGVPGRVDRGSSFAIVKNNKGGVDITMDGTNFSYAAADKQGNGYYRSDGGGAHQAHSWESAADKHSFSQLWSYSFEENVNSTHSGFAVVGAETKPEVLVNKASATYRGSMGGHTIAGPMQGDWRQLVSKGMDSTVLDVQFGANPTISGTISNMQIRDSVNDGKGWGPFRDMAGTLTLESAPISGNGYEGKVTADAAFINSVGFTKFENGKYAGRFYGPNGEEAAGVISGDNNVGSMFLGGFRAWE